MANETMKAARFHEYGPPQNLVVEEVDRPQPGPGQLLVRVRAAGVHPFDWKVRQGLVQQYMPIPLPHIPGIDFAGVVDEIGPDVTGFTRGDSVFGGASATYGEYALASAGAVAVKPARLSFTEAAAVPVSAATAWSAVIDVAEVQSGQSVLIHGGAGGVGMFAVQLAKWKGGTVTATTSSANVDFVKSLGADRVIDYTTTRFEDVVRDQDVVVDTVGGELMDRSWAVLKKGGILVEVAAQPSEEASKEHGVRLGMAQGQPTTELLTEIGRLIDEGRLKVEVGKVFPLENAADAHALSETGHGRGRIVLEVAGS